MSEVERLYITFDADGKPYIRGLRQVERETDQSTSKLEKRMAKLKKNMGEAAKNAGKAVAAGLAIGAAAMAAVGAASVKAAADFEYEMSRIKANAQGTAQEMEALEATVIQLGKDTVFSAGETAQAANELVKAGLSTAETMAALPGMLALASAGELNVAQAAEITANQLSVFNLAAEDAGSVADTLALTANRSTTEVDLLGQSLAMSGAVASQAGLTLQETSAALALLANNGLKGSDAGTSLKQMFMQLMGPSDKARDMMERYGISAYDSTGEMLDFDQVLESVAKGLKGTTDQERDYALATIFGSDAVRAANILLKEGADAYRDMTVEVSQAGAAQDIAATKMDNLRGSWEQLKGSVETAMITMGTSALGGVRGILDGLTQETNAFVETWEKLTGSDAWQQGGFEVKFDMAADTIVGALTDFIKKAGQAIGKLDWSRIGQTIGEGLLTLVETGVEQLFYTLLPMLGELAWGVVKAPFSYLADYVEKGREEFRRSEWAQIQGLATPSAEDRAAATATFGAGGIFDVGSAIGRVRGTMRLQQGWSQLGSFLNTAAMASVTREEEKQAVAAQEAAASAEVLAARTSTLQEAYNSIADPASAWVKVQEEAAAAADKTSESYDAAYDSLDAYLEKLNEQLERWAGFQEDIEYLIREFGDEVSFEAIWGAVSQGPDFTAMLADSLDHNKVVEALKTGLLLNSTDIQSFAVEYQELYNSLGAQSAAGFEEGWDGYPWHQRRNDVNNRRFGGRGALTAPMETDYTGAGTQAASTMSAGMVRSWNSARRPWDRAITNALPNMQTKGEDLGQKFINGLVAAFRGVNLMLNIGVQAGMGDLGMSLEDYARSLAGGSTGGMTSRASAAWNMLDTHDSSATFLGGQAYRPYTSDHTTGHAFDSGGPNMLSDALWGAANAEQLGVKYIIHNPLGIFRPGVGWSPYTPASSVLAFAGESAWHRDHIHWSFYDRGGMLPPGVSLAVNKTGQPEMILPPRTSEEVLALRPALDALDRRIATLGESITVLARNRGGGGTVIQVLDSSGVRAAEEHAQRFVRV